MAYPISKQQLAKLEKGYQAYNKAQQQQKVQSRSTLQKFAPAIGATVAGVAAAPFTGGLSLVPTLAALGAAGAVGSAAGERFAQTSNKEQTDMGRVRHEALVGGALSAVPIGGIAKATRVARTAERGVPVGISGKVALAGQRLESRAGGYGQGTKLPDGRRLTATQVQKIKALDRTERIPAGHPDDQGRVIEQRLTHANSQLDKAVTTGNRKLTATEKKAIPNNILKEVKANKAIATDPNALREANQLATSLKNVTSLKQAVKAKRDIQNEINFNRNSSAAVPGKEQANRIALKTLDNFINKAHPNIGTANTRVSGLIQRLELSGAESGALKNQSVQAGGGITGQVLTGDTAQTVKSKTGNILQKVAGGADRPVVAPGSLTRGGGVLSEAIKQGVGQNFLDAEQPLDVQPPDGFGPDVGAEPAVDPMVDPTQAAAGVAGPQGLEEALMQAQTILGADQTPATYLSYAKALMSGNKQNANQQKTQMALQNARNVVDELTQAYGQVGGPQGAGTGQVRNVLGRARIDQQARNYNDLRQAFLSRIARAFGEVGTLNEGDINRALGAIPDLADNKQTAARKLAILNNLLAKAQQNNTGGSPDLTDALSQLQGAY